MRLFLAPVRETSFVLPRLALSPTYETPKSFKMMYGTAWKEGKTAELVVAAVKSGFRAIDTANQPAHYHEPGVGVALVELKERFGIPRESLYIQTKYTPFQDPATHPPYDSSDDTATQVNKSVVTSLRHLGVDFIDSLLLHAVQDYRGSSLTPHDRTAWATMSAFKEKGVVGVIGVSNARAPHLAELCSLPTRPAFIQNRCFLNQQWDRAVRSVARSCGTVYQGFSLLTANQEAFRPDSVVSSVTQSLNELLKAKQRAGISHRRVATASGRMGGKGDGDRSIAVGDQDAAGGVGVGASTSGRDGGAIRALVDVFHAAWVSVQSMVSASGSTSPGSLLSSTSPHRSALTSASDDDDAASSAADLAYFQGLAAAAVAAGGAITPAQVIFRFALDLGMMPVLGPKDPLHHAADLAAAWKMPPLSPSMLQAIEMNTHALLAPPAALATPMSPLLAGADQLAQNGKGTMLGGGGGGGGKGASDQGGAVGDAYDGTPSDTIGAPLTTAKGYGIGGGDEATARVVMQLHPRGGDGSSSSSNNSSSSGSSSDGALGGLSTAGGGGGGDFHRIHIVELELMSTLAAAWTKVCASDTLKASGRSSCSMERAEAVPSGWGVDGFRGPPYSLVQFRAPAGLAVAASAALKARAHAKGPKALGGHDQILRGSVCYISGGPAVNEADAPSTRALAASSPAAADGWFFIALAEHSEWVGSFPVVGRVVSQLDTLLSLASQGIGEHMLKPAMWGQTPVVTLSPALPLTFRRDDVGEVGGGTAPVSLKFDIKKMLPPAALTSLLR